MLFNSYEFIFVFFPLVFVTFFWVARSSQAAASTLLAIASLFFYAWWNIKSLPLLLASILFNYLISRNLTPFSQFGHRYGKAMLWIGISANLGLLAFFKYANFLIGNTNFLLGSLGVGEISLLNIILPIGISFFTFTQIAYLVDSWQGKVRDTDFAHYVLFVSYFPHLIAGPILHHAQMMPQFKNRATYLPDPGKISIGVAIFTVGLTKKLFLADPLGSYANLLFSAVEHGISPQLLSSWLGTLAYTLQLYFDFSGYSDMAIGLSLMLGILLPMNFNAPYQATNIIDFWRRWHISLSIFLRDYLYIPLGGNKHGKFRRYLNLLATMILGGLWHGANWTFILWGAAHGLYLVINHLWRKGVGPQFIYGKIGRVLCWVLTFLSVLLAWVLFRADTVYSALKIYQGMLGLNGVSADPKFVNIIKKIFSESRVSDAGTWHDVIGNGNLPDFNFWHLCIAGMIIAFFIQPFAQTAFAEQSQSIFKRWNLGVIFALLLMLCIFNLGRESTFLYFQF